MLLLVLVPGNQALTPLANPVSSVHIYPAHQILRHKKAEQQRSATVLFCETGPARPALGVLPPWRACLIADSLGEIEAANVHAHLFFLRARCSLHPFQRLV